MKTFEPEPRYESPKDRRIEGSFFLSFFEARIGETIQSTEKLKTFSELSHFLLSNTIHYKKLYEFQTFLKKIGSVFFLLFLKLASARIF